MRKFLPIVALLAVAALAAFAPPKPKAPSLAVSVRAAGTIVWLKWTVAATPVDSLTVDVTGPTNLHRKYTASSQTDSVSYAKPAIGATIGGGVTGKSYRGAKSASAPVVPWSYTEPDTLPPPPPSVTVEVTPTSVTLPPNGTQQFTAKVS